MKYIKQRYYHLAFMVTTLALSNYQQGKQLRKNVSIVVGKSGEGVL